MAATEAIRPTAVPSREIVQVNSPLLAESGSARCGSFPPTVRAIYDRFLAMLEEFGPVTVLPEKTRIAFHIRMSFAQLTVRRRWVLGHFVLARRAEDPLFSKVETFSPRNHLHHFRLDDPADVDALRAFAGEACAVGRQEHLG